MFGSCMVCVRAGGRQVGRGRARPEALYISAVKKLSQRVAACLGAGAILLAMALLIVLFVGGHASRPRHGLQPAADTMRP